MCHPGGYGTKDGDDSAHSRGLEASHISNSKKLRSAHGGLFLGFMGITCAAVALTILVTPVDEAAEGAPRIAGLHQVQPVESFVLKGLWQPEGEEAKMRIAREAVAKRHENVFVEKRRTVRRMHKLEDSNQLVGDAGKDSVQETGMAARVTHDEADGNDEGRGQGMLRELIEKAKVKGISARRKGMDMEGAHRRKANVLESLVKKAKSEAASFQKETKFFVGAFDHNTHEQSAAK